MPHTLYQQLTTHGLLIPAKAVNLQLTFAAFANSSLFPTTLESPEFRNVVGPVVGGLVVGLPVFNLSDSVYVVLYSPENVDNLEPGSSKLNCFRQGQFRLNKVVGSHEISGRINFLRLEK
jgi:hypothetical protein